MNFNSQELDLMVRAMDAGDRFLCVAYGKGCCMKPHERASMRMVICSGKNVPGFVLRMICAGLEFMFWCEDTAEIGIPALLKKLEKICGYKRYGMEMQIAAQLEAAEA